MLYFWSLYIHLSRSVVNESPSRFSRGGPMERDAHLQSLFYTIFIPLSRSPVHEPLSGSPTAPLWKEMPIIRAFLYITFRVPNKGNPPPSSPQRAHIERDALFPEPSFNYLSGFLVKRHL